MALLKEDGSLDMERIVRLPLDDFSQEIGNLTKSQMEEYNSYFSKQSLNESNRRPIKVIIVDSTEEDVIKNRLVNMDELISEIRRKVGIL